MPLQETTCGCMLCKGTPKKSSVFIPVVKQQSQNEITPPKSQKDFAEELRLYYKRYYS